MMKKIIATIVLSLFCTISASSEAGKNAVYVFYEDGTYASTTWDKARDLMDHRRYVAVTVEQVKSPTPGALPTTFREFGFDVVAFRITGQNLILRAIQGSGGGEGTGPAQVQEHRFFAAERTSETNVQLTIPWQVADGGMDSVWSTIPLGTPGSEERIKYGNIISCIGDWLVPLQDDVVPNTGIYFDTALEFCLTPP